MGFAQCVDQQFAFAKAQLALAKMGPISSVQEFSIKQAIIGQLYLVLNYYAGEIANGQVSENQAFHKLLSTPFANPDFRVEEMRLLVDNAQSWVTKIIHLTDSLKSLTQPEIPHTQNKNIVISDKESASVHWKSIELLELEQLISQAAATINRHREISAEL